MGLSSETLLGKVRIFGMHIWAFEMEWRDTRVKRLESGRKKMAMISMRI